MASSTNRLIGFWYLIRDFFPIHLIFSQVKYNMTILLYWFFLFAIINGYFGSKFGVPFLFFSPEYLGETSIISFLLLGFSIGGFIMAFHTYSYIRLAPFYPFIATLSRPYFKFCVNNSAIPLIFVLNLLFNIWNFQHNQELSSVTQLILFTSGFLVGLSLFIAIAFLYFFPTNKNLLVISQKYSSEEIDLTESSIKTSFHKKQKWFEYFIRSKEEDTYTYIGKGFKIKQSRSYKHYDINMLRKVFLQNQTNATFFEITLLISFIVIGFFRDSDVFQVPASVSIMMLMTILLMIISAFLSWFKRWTYVIIILILLGMNNLSKTSYLFKYQSQAFGLDYSEELKSEYDPKILGQLYTKSEIVQDKKNYIQTLTNWKKKQIYQKPKLVIINTSGGGLRSALWTFKVMAVLDSLTNDKFSNSSHLITGASGGMVGASFYRDLLIKKDQGLISSLNDQSYLQNISKDLLNRLAFSLTTSDIFFRIQETEINGKKYPKDRGFAFEDQLIENLDGSLGKTLGYYREFEQKAVVPTMIFTPTIVNDGRRLLISSQDVGFLQRSSVYDSSGLNPLIENVEFQKLFRNNEPQNIRFSSVLRMSSTFPYIMPMVTMPSKPGMQVMDAGIRDNYGSKISVLFAESMDDWILENTSGIIIVKIRDTRKLMLDEQYYEVGMFDRIFLPFGNMYGNFPRVQDLNQDELIMNSALYKKGLIEVVSFNLRQKNDDQISLSWHLTKNEKAKINRAIFSEENQQAINKLIEMLNY